MLNFPTMQHADEVDGVDDLDRRNTARKCFMPTSMKKQQKILSKYMYDSTTVRLRPSHTYINMYMY